MSQNNFKNPTPLSMEELHGAALASEHSYHADSASPPFTNQRSVEQYLLVGELFAGIRVDPQDPKVAYVAVRGTSEIGNWIFTNFQAFYAPLHVVDDSLCHAPSKPFQGGEIRTPVEGKIHMGFFRAFSWLWYGSEPILEPTQRSRSLARQQFIKYVAIFFGPLILWLAYSYSAVCQNPFSLTSIVSLLLFAFIVVCLENGVVEDSFRIRTSQKGTRLMEGLPILNQYEKVIFTGHSLGGAVAAISFAFYRCWCQSDASRKDNGYLVTFGAPRIGDKTFIEKFEAHHEGLFVHFVHPGDPVPELPPNGLGEILIRRMFFRGLLGAFVALLFPFWTLYKYVYRVPRPARWKKNVVNNLGLPCFRRLCFLNHRMNEAYLSFFSKPKSES